MKFLNFTKKGQWDSYCHKYNISRKELRGKIIVKSIFNTDYLNDSDKLYYILGYIASDGTIDRPPRNRVRLCLHKKDKHILDEMKKYIFKNYNDIKLYETKGKYLSLHISDKNFVEKCVALGMTPCKTKVMKLNFDIIPEEYRWSFVRGYFDGDGSATIIQNSYKGKKYKKYVRATFCGNEHTMKLFFKFFESYGIKSSLKDVTYRGYTFPFYEIYITTIKDCDLFTYYLYKNSTIHLIRKYNRLVNKDYGV